MALRAGYTFLLFKIPVHVFSRKKVLERVFAFLENDSFHRIATVGPEFLLLARESERFRKNLLSADLRIADGFGVTLVGWLHGKNIERFPGADLLQDILKEAETRNLSVFLVIRKDGLSSLKEIQKVLLKKYPKLKVAGEEFEVESLKFKIESWRLAVGSSEVVFCNFGAPEQEYFLESLRGYAKSVRLAMGVGGAFDFLTGKLPRAPKFFRASGLEWLWRLFLQPKRWKRIWRAVIVFPVFVIKEKLFQSL